MARRRHDPFYWREGHDAGLGLRRRLMVRSPGVIKPGTIYNDII